MMAQGEATGKTDIGGRTGKTGKLVFQLLLGMVSGAGAMIGALWLLERYDGLLDRPEVVFALGTAVVFLLTGLLVGIGAFAPGVGAKTLNVEDADELTEQKPALIVGAASFLLNGLFLLLITIAPGASGEGAIPTGTAAVIAGMVFIASAALSIRYRNLGDEMMQTVSREANGWMVGLVFVVLGGWATLAHLGMAGAPAPLLIVAGLFALYLVAVFIAVGRRGMLKPR